MDVLPCEIVVWRVGKYEILMVTFNHRVCVFS